MKNGSTYFWKFLWIFFGISMTLNVASDLCTKFENDPNAVTIIINCTIPVFAAFIVWLVSELQSVKRLADSLDDDE